MKSYRVAVVGATGLVGSEMIKVLEEMKFPVKELVPLASERSAGKTVNFKTKKIEVQVLNEQSFKDVDVALFSAGSSVSKVYAPIAAKAGAVVIDNTSCFRMDKDVPLVVPEVNGEAVKEHKGIIANPNCSTAQMVLALKPLHDKYRIRRVIVSTYQAVSGAGKSAMDELLHQSANIMNGKGAGEQSVFTKQIAFNLIPHIDVFMDNGFTKEEMKMTNETKKILADEQINVVAHCVRVPVFIGHSEAVNVDMEKGFDVDTVRKELADVPNMKIMDDPDKNVYPTPLECVGTNDTLIGRIRRDFTVKNGLMMFIVSNNLRKGAAFNAVQIAFECINQSVI